MVASPYLALCDAQKAEFDAGIKRLAPLANGANVKYFFQTIAQTIAAQRNTMTSKQITFAQCAVLSGLGSNEMMLGVTPSVTHNSLHASYMLHSGNGWEAVRDMIVADIRASLDLGALKQAADLLIVLRRFLFERLRIGVVRSLHAPAKIVSFRLHSRVCPFNQL